MFTLAITYSPKKLLLTTNFLMFLSPPHSHWGTLLFFLFSLQKVVAAVRAGVNPSGNSSNQTSLWDLSSSFFFAGTVITTIGKESGFLLAFESPVACNALKRQAKCRHAFLLNITAKWQILVCPTQVAAHAVSNNVFNKKILNKSLCLWPLHKTKMCASPYQKAIAWNFHTLSFSIISFTPFALSRCHLQL